MKASTSVHAAIRNTSPLWRWTIIGILFVAVIAAFSPAFNHRFVDWDDTDNFIRNPHFRGLGWENIRWMFSTFHMGHYQPLTWLTLGWDSTWGNAVFGPDAEHGPGMDPRAYHITNLLLHAINTVLVFYLARALMLRAQRQPLESWAVLFGSAFAAALFGLHPLRVESVAWATERRDLLSGFFLLLASLVYVRHAPQQNAMSMRWQLITLVLFVCSLLSKVIGVTLPVVLLILDWYPLRRLSFSPAQWFHGANRRIVLEKVPYFAASLLFALVASIGQGRNQWLVTLEMHGIVARIVQSFYGLCFYLGKWIMPANLSPLYQLQLPMNVSEPRFVLAIVVVLIVGSLVVLLRNRFPALVAATLVYVITLLPVLGLMQNGPQLVADRYSYLPLIGFAVLAGGLMMSIFRTNSSAAKTGIVVFGLALSLVLAVLTWRQTQIWRDTSSLWTHMYRMDPDSGFAQNGYGFVLLEQNRIKEAIPILRQAVKTQPNNEKAHHNLWRALRRKGDIPSLLSALQNAMTLDAIRADAAFEYANYELEQNNNTRALALYEMGLAVKPLNVPARTNMGVVLVRLGRRDEAIQQYRQVIAINPDFFHARYNLGMSLKASGRPQEAVEHLKRAVELRPDHIGARNALDEARNTTG